MSNIHRFGTREVSFAMHHHDDDNEFNQGDIVSERSIAKIESVVSRAMDHVNLQHEDKTLYIILHPMLHLVGFAGVLEEMIETKMGTIVESSDNKILVQAENFQKLTIVLVDEQLLSRATAAAATTAATTAIGTIEEEDGEDDEPTFSHNDSLERGDDGSESSYEDFSNQGLTQEVSAANTWFELPAHMYD
ncbi:hypothetical protein SEMRO_1016_G231590.1 [Seminavis robusta]|uniref:Uncharacterized protein n=1 Tax=Seminavis robusta TaxID=568900 RepID=A0A9N8EDG5_9STRA|nr:hypothetical protein SEMRO_1016_G231590.1 [Seminavis robusta]|eukprot:Sro1016_g231590.1 n/a (191) ;mRNA; f:5341-5913